MKTTFTLTATLLALFTHLAPALAQIDRGAMWAYSGTGCAGTRYTCPPLQIGQCCGWRRAVASLRLEKGAEYDNHAYTHPGCTGTTARGPYNSCHSPTWAIWSAKMGYAFDWEEGRLAVRKEADTASGEEFPCVEPVEILFVNGDGQEVNVRIPEGRFEEAADEVEKKNWEFFADETVWVRIE